MNHPSTGHPKLTCPFFLQGAQHLLINIPLLQNGKNCLRPKPCALELRGAAHATAQSPNRIGVEVLLGVNLFGTSEAHLPYITPAKGIEENCPFVNNFSQTN